MYILINYIVMSSYLLKYLHFKKKDIHCDIISLYQLIQKYNLIL